MVPRLTLATAMLVLAVAGPTAAAAQSAGDGIVIELNKTEQHEGACWLYMLFDNRDERRYDRLEVDLVLFDGDGIVIRRQPVLAPLAPAHMSLKVYNLDGLQCGAVDRILVNDVTCGGASGEDGSCLGMVEVRSRGSISLVK